MRFQVGNDVYVPDAGSKSAADRGKLGIVKEAITGPDGKPYYRISFEPGDQGEWFPEAALQLYLTRTVEERIVNVDFGEPSGLVTSLFHSKLKVPLTNNLYTFYATRTQFVPHQFKAVLKFVLSPNQRLLLADEVGLGKTIEAGLVMSELEARAGTLERVLIVCPAGLRRKWQEEMRRKFGRPYFELASGSDLLAFARQSREEMAERRFFGVCSYHSIRRIDVNVLHSLEVLPRFDMIVVDEAHWLRNRRNGYDVIELLSSIADSMLLLTATPLHLGNEDLFSLVDLLAPEDFGDFRSFSTALEPNRHINRARRLAISDPAEALGALCEVEGTSHGDRLLRHPDFQRVQAILLEKAPTREELIEVQQLLMDLNSLSYLLTRTKKRDVEEKFAVRRAKTLKVEWTPAEYDLYNAATRWIRAKYSTGFAFPLISLQRQVTSCLPAAAEKIRTSIAAQQLASSEEESDVQGHDEESGFILALTTEDKETLSDRFLSRLSALGQDSKFQVFSNAVQEILSDQADSKILVFAFFKGTLEYLYDRLRRMSPKWKFGLMHGDVPINEREDTMSKFRHDPRFRLLLSSEVGSEGLDFEFCDVLFNYDLPWNPMVVEQRIGRLDRFGQASETIRIFNFSVEGTIDDVILNKLYRRIGIFEASIGDLESILGDEVTELSRCLLDPTLSEPERELRVEKIAENMIRKKQDLEKLEGQSAELLGAEDYFKQEIDTIIRQKRYVTAEEVEACFTAFLQNEYPEVKLSASRKQDRLLVMSNYTRFKNFVLRYTRGEDRMIRDRIERKLDRGDALPITFDYQLAATDKSGQYEFVTIFHPFIKAIFNICSENEDLLSTTAKGILESEELREGLYLLLVYQMHRRGLRAETHLVPILLGFDKPVEEFGTDTAHDVLYSINRLLPWNEDMPEPSAPVLQELYEKGNNHIIERRQADEAEFAKRNSAKIDFRIAVHRDAAHRRINAAESRQATRLESIAVDPDSDPVVRMERGRIRKETERLQELIESLEKKRQVTVSYKLVAGCLLYAHPG